MKRNKNISVEYIGCKRVSVGMKSFLFTDVCLEYIGLCFVSMSQEWKEDEIMNDFYLSVRTLLCPPRTHTRTSL